MKKLFNTIIATILALATLTFTACGTTKLAMGKELLTYKSQLDAVVQLDAGTVDAVVIDSIMAGYYSVEGDYAGKIAIVPNLILAEEEYGIAGRKQDKAFISKINEALIALNGNGQLLTVANQFGLSASLAIDENTTNPLANETDNSWNDILQSGTIVIGYTVFAPIAYNVGNTFTGFDIELARSVVDYLNQTYTVNLEIEFLEIEWNAKEALLEEGSIDLVWNGMTINQQRLNDMCISVPYLYNRQVAVVNANKLANYTDKASFANAVMGAEAGSAGEKVIKG